MPEEVISRVAIARQAEQAAQRSAATGRCEVNPYAPGSDAAKAWDVSFRRYLQLHSGVEESEGGA